MSPRDRDFIDSTGSVGSKRSKLDKVRREVEETLSHQSIALRGRNLTAAEKKYIRFETIDESTPEYIRRKFIRMKVLDNTLFSRSVLVSKRDAMRLGKWLVIHCQTD